MLTAKEKALELVEKFLYCQIDNYGYDYAKQCALISVDELIVQNGELYINSLGAETIDFYKKKNAYLFDVKTEIEKL